MLNKILAERSIFMHLQNVSGGYFQERQIREDGPSSLHPRRSEVRAREAARLGVKAGPLKGDRLGSDVVERRPGAEMQAIPGLKL